MKRTLSLITLLFTLTLILSACGGEIAVDPAEAFPTDVDELTTISVDLSLGYIPDVQFAPYYVGIEKGFFAERGIDLNIEHRWESEGAKLVAIGEIEFAVVSGEQVLLGRQQELPIVYVYEWYQQFPIAIVSKTAAGITSPEGLTGRSIGVSQLEGASYIGLQALLASAGLSEADIDLQATGYSQVETLSTDIVEAVVVYTANEPIQLEALGEEVNLIAVSDYADLVSNGIITSEALIAENPDLVRAMVAAFNEALQYTIDNPEEAFEISKIHVEGLGDADIESAQYETLLRSIVQWDGDQLGKTETSSWVEMQNLLISMGLLTGEGSLEEAFTNNFLP